MASVQEETPPATKKKYPKIVKCMECGGTAIRVRAEGFNSEKHVHETIDVGTTCRHCGTLVIQPTDHKKILIPNGAIIERYNVENI